MFLDRSNLKLSYSNSYSKKRCFSVVCCIFVSIPHISLVCRLSRWLFSLVHILQVVMKQDKLIIKNVFELNSSWRWNKWLVPTIGARSGCWFFPAAGVAAISCRATHSGHQQLCRPRTFDWIWPRPTVTPGELLYPTAVSLAVKNIYVCM